jgi:hypothetical protein
MPEEMYGRHRAGGVACWFYRCVHVERDENGKVILMPHSHPECGMWTAVRTAELFR